MAEAFDPYHKWLGIPPEDQPPDHYRLLAIKPFEEDPDVIASAADRQMKHLRDFQTGPHAPLSQKLLNEVATARICLLNAEKKSAYDEQLRQQSAAQAPARKPPVVAHAVTPEGGGSSGQETVEWTGLRELGEYRLLEKLGAGGMGEVYKALHTEMQRVVAVKVLPPGFVQDERAVARFKREIKAVASLSHPNIVQAFDAREVEGTRFLVMEYLEGLDLRDVAKRLGPLPIPEACELIRQAALGLQCAHEHGLVHRDIKPGNLMLTAQGQVKILDLGLARPQAEGGEGEVTGTGEAMGTADYMAPEQAQDSRSVDIRADIYSLGCTLYRLIAGRPPFSGPKYDTAVKKLMGHIQDPVPPITRFRNDVPKRLEIVLGRLLAKDAAKRLATPADLAEALVPLSVGADLGGLYSASTGKIPRPPAPGQTEVATQSSQSSGLTRFFDKFKRAAPEPAGHATAAKPSQKTPAWVGYAAIGAVALLVILAWGVWSATRQGERPSAESEKRAVAKRKDDSRPQPRRPRPTPKETTGRLVLQWPADQRGDAMLDIDDQRRDVAELISTTDPEALSVELKPGSHKVWIVRRGYEPFEQNVTVEAGKIATLAPQWKKMADVVVVPQPKPGATKPETKPPDVAVEKPKPKPGIKPEPPQPKVDPAILAREKKWRNSMEPVEKTAAAWDFAGAQTALGGVRFDEPELQQRLVHRGDELKRMAALKSKIIARIKAASPRFNKSDLGLRGINGEVTGADDQAIHARLSGGKTEDHAWAELNEKARPELLKLAIDQASADDWLAGGLMAFAAGDVTLAEKLLDKAKSLGADIVPYLGSLASAAFARSQELLEKEEWTDAEKGLSQLQEKYGHTPWFEDNKPLFDAALAKAKRGIYEAEAEKLYADGKKLLGQKELFDLRDLVQNLKTEYPQSRAVTDAARKPPFGEMEQATANLGKRIIVRQDGKGDFQKIQEAINAADPDSLIEIHDNGPYNERVVFAKNRGRLTLRGRRGCWPVIVSSASMNSDIMVEVRAPRITLDRLVLLHIAPMGEDRYALRIPESPGSLSLRRVLLWIEPGSVALSVNGGEAELTESIILGSIHFYGKNSVSDCIVLGTLRESGSHVLRHGVFLSAVQGYNQYNLNLRDSIVKAVSSQATGSIIEHCDIYGATPQKNIPFGKGCLADTPEFANPGMLDFRLNPKSPCKGKASDGGDIGCRYTPEMIEMCKIALALRAKGIIKF